MYVVNCIFPFFTHCFFYDLTSQKDSCKVQPFKHWCYCWWMPTYMMRIYFYYIFPGVYKLPVFCCITCTFHACVLNWCVGITKTCCCHGSTYRYDDFLQSPDQHYVWVHMVMLLNTLKSSPPGQNGHHFGRWHFQLHFLEWKWYNYDYNFTEKCSQGSSWQ